MDDGDRADETLTVFPERIAQRTAEYQARKLRACGVDPALYGDTVETGLFGQDCFKAMTAGGVVLDGMVHMAQRFALHRPAMIDERLVQRGWIASDEADPRGRRIVQKFEFLRADGDIVVTAEMFRLKPDPAKMGASRGTRRKDEDPRQGLTLLDGKTMRPKDVMAFSEDVGNLIHFEPDFAKRYGYRAPISQGIQTMIWMMGALARDRPPQTFDVTARFARPVHWDDTVRLWASPNTEDQITGAPDVLRAINAEGKLAAELRVDAVTY
ncbi:MAG: MaoC family dehydratase [Proteobacteria bacterium]|nr:MaoC family dehydratase [Pseudomonadota bacterium]